MSVATITSKGQMTIPSALRRKLGLKTGEKVTVHALDDGAIIIRRKRPSLHEIAGMLGKSRFGRPLTQKDIDDAVAEGAVARFERATRRR